MVTTEIFETEVTGHIHRDLAGLFNASATALQQTAGRTCLSNRSSPEQFPPQRSNRSLPWLIQSGLVTLTG